MIQLQVQNKVVPIDAVPEVGNQCHVYVLDLYFEKLPPEAFTKYIFYLKPCSQPPKDCRSPWFTTNPIGKNTLANMVRDMCKDADIKGHKTKHSLRVTGATAMYQAGGPEKAIQEKTGYMSLTGLRHYERTNM